MMAPDHLSALPLSEACKANRHEHCSRRRCGCFCHPPGHTPIDEGDLDVPMMTSCPAPDCTSRFFDADLLGNHLERVHPGYTQDVDEESAAPSPAAGGSDDEATHPPSEPPAPSEEVLAEVVPIREEKPVPKPKKERTPCPWPDCPKTYTSIGYLNNHVIRDHGGMPGEVIDVPVTRKKDRPPIKQVMEERVEDEVVVEDYTIYLQVGAGVWVALFANSPMAFSLAEEALRFYSVPHTTTQPG